MRQQGRKIDAATSNNLHQPPHAFLSTGAQSGNYPMIAEAGGKCFVWYFQLTGVNTKTGKRPAGPQASQSTFECLLCSKCFDCHVDAAGR